MPTTSPSFSTQTVPTTTARAWVRPAASGPVTVSLGGDPQGQAVRVSLSNGWDAAGESFRAPRRDGESDLSYAGRLQRLWLTQKCGLSSGSSERSARVLAAYTGRVTVGRPWDGVGSSPLPGDADCVFDMNAPSRLVPGDGPRVLTLSGGDIRPLAAPAPVAASLSNRASGYPSTPLTGSLLAFEAAEALPSGYRCAFRADADLTLYGVVRLSSGARTLRQGRDWLVSQEDPTVFLLRTPQKLPATAGSGAGGSDSDLTLTLSRPQPVRVTVPGDAGSNPAWGTGRAEDALRREYLSSASARLVKTPDGTLALGRRSADPAPQPWNASPTTLCGPPARRSGLGPRPSPSPLVWSRQFSCRGLDRVVDRRLFLPGRSVPSPLGHYFGKVLRDGTQFRWSDSPAPPVSRGTAFDFDVL